MDKETYADYQASVKAEQEGIPKDQIMEKMTTQAEFSLDLDNLPRQKHNWVQRGAKISCEGADHPYHSHFLVGR